MEKILRHLMNCGFVIYELDYEVPKFAIEKIATPTDGRKVTDFADDTFSTSYNSFEGAMQKAQELSNWWSEVELHVWNVQIMYQHRGLGSLLTDLAPVVGSSYDVAIREAQLKGERYISRTFPDGDVKKWEVKIRPCGILREAKIDH